MYVKKHCSGVIVMEGLLNLLEVMEVTGSSPIDSIIFYKPYKNMPMGGCHMTTSHWLSYAM